MGEFNAGTWIVGLCLYFFVFFIVVFSMVNALAETGEYNSGISVHDPGFSSSSNIPFAQSGVCKGRPHYLCSSFGSINGIDNATACNSYQGCYWGANVFKDDSCKGVFIGSCDDYTNGTICSVVGCTWSDFTGLGATSNNLAVTFDWGVVKDTVGFMTGFDANLGAPSWLQFIISFPLFWLPFFMLLWSIYMALPFLH